MKAYRTLLAKLTSYYFIIVKPLGLDTSARTGSREPSISETVPCRSINTMKLAASSPSESGIEGVATGTSREVIIPEPLEEAVSLFREVLPLLKAERDTRAIGMTPAGQKLKAWWEANRERALAV